jgi:hypothetical protein
MKRIVRRVQSLNERAAELTAAASQLPNRVAELRQAMTATSGQLQSLKTDIQVNVADLVIDREDDLSAALADIAGHAPVLAQAGFLIEGLDIEVSPVQRLVVQLLRIGDAEPGEIEDLIQQHPGQTTLRAILSAILKARAVAASIKLDGLDYHQLLIGLGPVPIIRLGWRAASAVAAPAASSTRASWQPSVSQPLPGGSSFFGPSATIATLSPPSPEALPFIEEPAPAIPTPPPTAGITALPDAAAPPPPAAQDTDPLARFKVMPDLHRPRAPRP